MDILPYDIDANDIVGGRRIEALGREGEFTDAVTSEANFTKTITVVDCWLYGRETISSVRHDIEEPDVEKWLSIPNPASENGQKPSAGLRIIHRGQWESRRSPFTSEVTQAINHAFDLPVSALDFTSSLSGTCVRLSSTDSTVFVCRRPSSGWTITTVLRYCHRTNVTVGYVYSATPLRIVSDLEAIPSQFYEFPHPLLVPMLMHELALGYLAQNIDRSDKELQVIEAQTGFSDYPMMSSAEQTNYRPQIERLGRVTHHFAYDQVRLHTGELTNQFLRKQLNSIETWLRNEERRTQLSAVNKVFQERLDSSWSTIEHLRVSRGLEKRLQVRQNVLFNLIAQQDSAANMEVAAAARRDSSAMKVIAVLTALFLPGTFVAAFFAIPMFDWRASDGTQVVSNRFWIYWAVAVPLTVVTGVVIMRWVISRSRENMKNKMW